MTAMLIAAIVYVAVAVLIVATWAWSSQGEDDREWFMCALVAVLWPLLLVAGVLG